MKEFSGVANVDVDPPSFHLHTGEILSRNGWVVSSRCSLCGGNMETVRSI